MNRKIIFSPGSYYHIFDRGTDKRDIFVDTSDYKRFSLLLYLCNNTQPIVVRDYLIQLHRGRTYVEKGGTLVDIGAYCLMPNHFHLLVKEKSENGISSFMKKINTGHAMYFNKKNERSGNLFQGKFQATLVDQDRYLKYLFAYIHLNPIKLIEAKWKENIIKDRDKAKNFLNNYLWSSYPYFTGQKEADMILNTKEFPEYFKNTREFSEFIEDWLEYQD